MTTQGEKTKDRMHWGKGFIHKGEKRYYPYTHVHFQWPANCVPGLFAKKDTV